MNAPRDREVYFEVTRLGTTGIEVRAWSARRAPPRPTCSSYRWPSSRRGSESE